MELREPHASCSRTIKVKGLQGRGGAWLGSVAGKPDLGEGTGAEARKTSQPGADVKGEGTIARTPREQEGGGQGPGVAHVCGGLTCEGRLCHQRARAVGVRLREESRTPAQGR